MHDLSDAILELVRLAVMVFTIRNRITDKKERFVVAFCFLVMVVWMILYIAGPQYHGN